MNQCLGRTQHVSWFSVCKGRVGGQGLYHLYVYIYIWYMHIIFKYDIDNVMYIYICIYLYMLIDISYTSTWQSYHPPWIDEKGITPQHNLGPTRCEALAVGFIERHRKVGGFGFSWGSPWALPHPWERHVWFQVMRSLFERWLTATCTSMLFKHVGEITTNYKVRPYYQL